MDTSIFDKRVVRRNMEKGLITQQDYLEYLKGLEDKNEECEPVEERLYPKDETEEEQKEESPDAPPMEMP